MRRIQWNANVRKTGVYYGLVKHTRRYHGPQLAIVKFDGNKRTSRVPLNELQFLDKGEHQSEQKNA